MSFFSQLRDLFFYACRCQRCRIYHRSSHLRQNNKILSAGAADDLCNLVIFQYTICGCRRRNLKLEAADLWLGVGNAHNSRKVCSPNRLLPLLIDTSIQYFARGKLFRFTKCKNEAWINIWSSLCAHIFIDLMPKPRFGVCMRSIIKRRAFDRP